MILTTTGHGRELILGTNDEIAEALENLARYASESQGAFSKNTMIAQASDVRVFAKWCKANAIPLLPVTAQTLAAYIDNMAKTKKKNTITRAVSSIRTLNQAAGFNDPKASGSTVKLALRRLVMKKAGEGIKQAEPLRWSTLADMVDNMPQSPNGIRDRALLLTAYDTLCRRSELAAMTVENLDFVNGVVEIPVSKTNKVGGVDFRHLNPDTMKALGQWLSISGIESGPVFVSTKGPLAYERMTPKAIYDVFKKRGFSGHSARVGSAIDQRANGVSFPQIAASGGWKGHTMPAQYSARIETRESGAAILGRIQNRGGE